MQINNIRDKNGDITTETTEIWRTIGYYFENVYSNAIEKIEEMEIFKHV